MAKKNKLTDACCRNIARDRLAGRNEKELASLYNTTNSKIKWALDRIANGELSGYVAGIGNRLRELGHGKKTTSEPRRRTKLKKLALTIRQHHDVANRRCCGKSVRSIAKSMRVSPATINRALQRVVDGDIDDVSPTIVKGLHSLGIKPTLDDLSSKITRPGMTRDDINKRRQAIIAERQSGKSVAAVAKQFNLSESTVRRIAGNVKSTASDTPLVEPLCRSPNLDDYALKTRQTIEGFIRTCIDPLPDSVCEHIASQYLVSSHTLDVFGAEVGLHPAALAEVIRRSGYNIVPSDIRDDIRDDFASGFRYIAELEDEYNLPRKTIMAILFAAEGHEESDWNMVVSFPNDCHFLEHHDGRVAAMVWRSDNDRAPSGDHCQTLTALSRCNGRHVCVNPANVSSTVPLLEAQEEEGYSVSQQAALWYASYYRMPIVTPYGGKFVYESQIERKVYDVRGDHVAP